MESKNLQLPVMKRTVRKLIENASTPPATALIVTLQQPVPTSSNARAATVSPVR
jgi:hypothetical protein